MEKVRDNLFGGVGGFVVISLGLSLLFFWALKGESEDVRKM
jgi:hypothetical protein